MTNQPNTFVETAARKREIVSYALIVVGLLLLGMTIVWSVKWNSERNLPPSAGDESAQETIASDAKKKTLTSNSTADDYLTGAIWSSLLAVMLVGAGGWNLTRKPTAGQDVHESRVLLMSVGGISGGLTALLGFALAWRWQPSILLWIDKGEVAEGKWVVAALAVFFAGLALLFFSMQLGRAEERSSVLIRRVLHGGNALLSGLLLLLVLIIANVAVFVKLPDNVITTAAAFKGLSNESREFLRTINQPVNIYLAMPENYDDESGYTNLYTDCRALLRAIEQENKNIKAIYLSPVSDSEEIRRIQDRLELSKDDRRYFGFMIGFGDDEKPSGFVPVNGLLRPNREGLPTFQGEARLMTELNFLSGGAKRPVVYFTQSNREPSMSGPTETNTHSCRELVRYLTERKFEVKPLVLETGKRPDLSDANLVIIAAPHTPFRPEQVEMLRAYLFPKKTEAPPGKIIAFLPAVAGPDGNVALTGLEPLLIDVGIHVEPKRLLSLPNQGFTPFYVMGAVAPSLRRVPHPFARLPDDFQLPFDNVRPVSPVKNAPPNLSDRPLLSNSPDRLIYQDQRFDSNPVEIERVIIKEQQQGISRTLTEKMFTDAAIPFATYAADKIEQEKGFVEKPRVVVIGSDSMIDDAFLTKPSLNPEIYLRLAGSLIEWTRERPPGMNIEPRDVGTFSLSKETDDFGLFLLPVILIALGILGLGVGVWVARRR